MGRYIGPKCKMCRQEKVKLFLKGKRCLTKCMLDRRSYRPGEHGQKPRKPTDYAIRLREKQKLRRIYGIMEGQFKNYFFRVRKENGITGENLIRLLERRLDNVVFRFGFVSTRAEARQLITHGHILINDKKVNIPSYQIKIGDVVRINDGSGLLERIKESMSLAAERGVPSWLEIDETNLAGIVKSFPTMEESGLPIQEALIVEFYSK
ncbi:30S ribosomal protein S4 [Candidatus Desantisbacteria bacterium CG1_02_38_46]|uniref:Small ribosomal subunit protein uS4 n=2 Tax=unclassified Candidatus Desantisiibacteriota TaxID=3106372 RepID=A0A1J4SGQ1_9BACT|nr:MAG: 30S ribosomal protein S4 [Candidatus Desantisbacteria bacterium CG1_02_38_46]PIU51339.1 MAG: 30S ribosomal protein S4 [Candidatus Desantisbacteria bacterium CG07_land_8_20_14_0_80_39_15]